MGDENKRKIHQTSPETPPASKRSQMATQIGGSQVTFDQMLAALDTLMDKKLEKLATKDDVKNELQLIREECVQLKEKVTQLAAQDLMNKCEIEKLKNHNRRYNLIFTGIPVVDSERISVINFCRDILGIQDRISIRHAKYIGNKGDRILVELDCQEDIIKILSNGNKLRGRNMSVSRDFSYSMRKKRSYLHAIKKEIKKIRTEVNTYVRGDQLVVDKVEFTCLEDGTFLCKGEDGRTKLAEICNYDFSEFIKNLPKSSNQRKEQNN